MRDRVYKDHTINNGLHLISYKNMKINIQKAFYVKGYIRQERKTISRNLLEKITGKVREFCQSKKVGTLQI